MKDVHMLGKNWYLTLSCADGMVYSSWHDQNYRLKWIMSGDNGASVNILAIFQLFRSTRRQFCHKISSTLCLFVYLPILPQNNLSSISLSIFDCNKCFTSSKYPQNIPELSFPHYCFGLLHFREQIPVGVETHFAISTSLKV